MPIYQGGAEYSTIRQAKETLGQRRIDLDTQRDQARADVVQAWGQLEAAKAQIQATQTQVTAAEIALNGVREEARVGQRTTLDVLNAQQELVNARVSLVTAQRDRVVALLYAAGGGRAGCRSQVLALQVPSLRPAVHYHQVRDTWVGVRTPDGQLSAAATKSADIADPSLVQSVLSTGLCLRSTFRRAILRRILAYCACQRG